MPLKSCEFCKRIEWPKPEHCRRCKSRLCVHNERDHALYCARMSKRIRRSDIVGTNERPAPASLNREDQGKPRTGRALLKESE